MHTLGLLQWFHLQGKLHVPYLNQRQHPEGYQKAHQITEAGNHIMHDVSIFSP